MKKFPKPSEFFLRDDPMMRVRKSLQMHGFSGRKKYFWTIATLIKTFLLIIRITYILSCLNQPKRTAELTASLPVAITGVLKLFHLYFDEKRVKYFYDTITNDFWDYRISGKEIEEQALSGFSFTNRIIGFHFGISWFCVIMFLIYPVGDMPKEDDRVLPNVLWAPFDLNPSPLYEIVYTILILNGILTYLGNIAYDFLFVYCVQHLFVQFLLLKGLLENVTEGIMDDSSDVNKFKSAYFQKTVLERLKICAEHHARLLQYGKNIQIFCSQVLVPQMIMTYASLVVNGFTLSMDRSDFSKTVILFNLSISTFLQLVLFAIPSSQLNDQSITVLNAIYSSKWYLFNAPVKRACTFMMMNVKEIVIKAGSTTKIDNPFLVEMLQKVFSAITLLKALVEGNATN